MIENNEPVDTSTVYASIEHKQTISELSKLAVNDKQEDEIKSTRTSILQNVYVFGLLGVLAVIGFPYADMKVTGGYKPGLITFCGVGLSMTLLTIALFQYGIATKLSMSKLLLRYAIIFNLIIIFLKMVIAPATVYINDPTINVDLGKGGFIIGGDISNFNSNPMIILIMAIGLFGMYAIVFHLLAHPSKYRITKLFNIQSLKKAKIKSTKKIPIGVILLMIALVMLTGGALVLLPLLLIAAAVSAPEPIFDWLGYAFGGLGGVAVAVALVAAIIFARQVLIEAEKRSIALKSLQFFVTFVWLSILLLATFHVIWAVYLFVLTTLWPFKVMTYGVAPK